MNQHEGFYSKFEKKHKTLLLCNLFYWRMMVQILPHLTAG